MKAQAIAALGVILVWLFGNNATLNVAVSDPDLGTRTEQILLKDADPIIGQLALVALIGSAVIWLTGGLVRRLISLVNVAVLGYLSFAAISLLQSSAEKISDKLSITGEISQLEFGVTVYAVIAAALISTALYLASVKTYSADQTRRPSLNSDRDTWRAQDEGKDNTA